MFRGSKVYGKKKLDKFKEKDCYAYIPNMDGEKN